MLAIDSGVTYLMTALATESPGHTAVRRHSFDAERSDETACTGVLGGADHLSGSVMLQTIVESS